MSESNPIGIPFTHGDMNVDLSEGFPGGTPHEGPIPLPLQEPYYSSSVTSGHTFPLHSPSPYSPRAEPPVYFSSSVGRGGHYDPRSSLGDLYNPLHLGPSRTSNLTQNLLRSQQTTPQPGQLHEGVGFPAQGPPGSFGQPFGFTAIASSSGLGGSATNPPGFNPHSYSSIPIPHHHTPTVVSSSYTSNHSYTNPSHLVSSSVGNNSFQSTAPAHSIPTTRTETVSVFPHQGGQSFPSHAPFHQPHPQSVFQPEPPRGLQEPTTEVPSRFAREDPLSSRGDPSTPMESHPTGAVPVYDFYGYANIHDESQMSYQDFLATLDPNEEHLNIASYPVDKLLTMLASLLTKIVDANDKLHPNHFNKLSQQLLQNLEFLQPMQQEPHSGQPFPHEGLQVEDPKPQADAALAENRYLANVLAFHGKNVPAISLHAYLTRVLKYCPVTNEVFLSLLVYFDRIAKKATALAHHHHHPPPSLDQTGLASFLDVKSEQFVMDSFNIHRLIISGITVSSKFFSDIFYKNSRYAKVGGLPLEELNYLEIQFLLLIDFKLLIGLDELQKYGDLLLRFWARQSFKESIGPTDFSGEEPKPQE